MLAFTVAALIAAENFTHNAFVVEIKQLKLHKTTYVKYYTRDTNLIAESKFVCLNTNINSVSGVIPILLMTFNVAFHDSFARRTLSESHLSEV